MPQEFQVLCCYKCEMFQVHHMKKAKKWHCKICNEKQSFRKAYKISSAPDCRFFCQKLNMRKGGVKVDSETDGDEEADNIFANNEHASAVSDDAGVSEFGDQSLSENENEDFYEESRNIAFSDNTSLFPSTTIESSNKTVECFQEEIVQPIETSEFHWDIGFKDSSTFAKDTVNESLDIKNSKEFHKRPLEIKSAILSQSPIMPPVKKNRGFQMIKNIKHFQEENVQPTEISRFSCDFGFKQSDIIAVEKTYEAIVSKNSKESYQCPFGSKANVPSQPLTMQPVKKNRAFQIIKNAASKLS